MKKSLNNKILLLFTISYPYAKAAENTFLNNEIPFLSKYFDKVVILPESEEGEKEEIVYANLEIDNSLALYLRKNKVSLFLILKQFFYLSFYKEIFYSRLFINFNKIKKTLTFLARASLIRSWFINYYQAKGLLNRKVLLYTYWTTSTTFGLCKLKYKLNLKIISRAHGIDLYEERGYVCCRRETLKLIDEIHTVSEAGLKYLSNKYAQYSNKILCSTLGVKGYSKINTLIDDQKFILVSCSQIIDIKRVDLIAKALLLLSQSKSLQVKKFVWYHFGDGELKDELLKITKRINSEIVECNIMGYVKNNLILDFYANNQVDLFISTSKTEGGRPLSIQEALSFGIPVLATKVGGIPEIIDNNVGALLSENPSVEDIAKNILYFYENKEKANKMRLNAFSRWMKDLNAEKNFSNFVKKISSLIYDEYNNY